jgi:hypothetical protein
LTIWLTSDVTDFLFGEVRQTGSAEAFSLAVVGDPLFEVWWVVSSTAEDGMSVQPQLKHQQPITL